VIRIAIILAACALMAGQLSAESSNDRQRSAWPEEQDTSKKTPLWKWLKSGTPQEAAPASPADEEPVASDPAPEPPKKQRSKKVAEPEPEPEPKLTPDEQAAEDLWWKETGDKAVAGFSSCLAEHVVAETSSGSQSSYPDFVTTAMNGRCSREFAAMAQLILDRHGEDNFARIARKLIATKFVPAVKQVVEAGPPEAAPPQDDRSALQAGMRQSKEELLGCLMDEADRIAAASAAEPEAIADRVIAACQDIADAFFAKLEQLYPGATGGKAGFAAILDASYRPAVVQRIAGVRQNPMAASSIGTKADAETPPLRLPRAAKQDAPAAVSPAVEPASGSPVPASSRP
jgi:hypothetical protein